MNVISPVLVFLLTLTVVQAQDVEVSGCGIAAGGNARDNIINCFGVSEEKVDEILALLKAQNERQATAVARQLGVTETAIIFLAKRIAGDTDNFDQAIQQP